MVLQMKLDYFFMIWALKVRGIWFFYANILFLSLFILCFTSFSGTLTTNFECKFIFKNLRTSFQTYNSPSFMSSEESEDNLPIHENYACNVAILAHSIHYLRRICETLFVHRFSSATFAVRHIPKVR